jgi:hypothetical protein
MQRLQAKQRTVGWNLNFLSNKEQNYRFLLENLKHESSRILGWLIFFGKKKNLLYFSGI